MSYDCRMARPTDGPTARDVVKSVRLSAGEHALAVKQAGQSDFSAYVRRLILQDAKNSRTK